MYDTCTCRHFHSHNVVYKVLPFIYLQFELQLWQDGEQDRGVDGVQLKDEVVQMLSYLTLRALAHHKSIVEELEHRGRRERHHERNKMSLSPTILQCYHFLYYK